MASVLVACETSGIVRNAFLKRCHDCWSCDLFPSDDGSNRHIIGDARPLLRERRWNLIIVAHPPCTRLCNSGVRWLTDPPTKLSVEHYTRAEVAAYARMNRRQRRAFMWQKLRDGAALFSDFWNAPADHVACENPVMHRHAKKLIDNYEEFSQSVQPWQFGHRELKRTCLWLRDLPNLQPTKIIQPPKDPTLRRKWARVHNASPGPLRWKERSRFFTGIADAMADQWGALLPGGNQAEAA
jgi:hypothetical protein